MIKKKIEALKYSKIIEILLYIVLFSAILFAWYYLFYISDIVEKFLNLLNVFVQTQPRYVYLVAYLAAVAEGTIILGSFPGTTFIITLGVFVARGDVDPFFLFPVVILGAFLGDLLGYSIGSYTKKCFVNSSLEKTPHFKLALEFVKKHGAKSVFFARFVSGIKEATPFLAGILKMDMKKFMFFNFLGAIGWSVLWISVGYISGLFITNIENIVKTIGLIFLVLFIFSIYTYYKKNIRKFY